MRTLRRGLVGDDNQPDHATDGTAPELEDRTSSIALLTPGDRLEEARSQREQLASLATGEQQSSQRRGRLLWKACALAVAVDVVAAALDYSYFRTVRGPTWGGWVKGRSVLWLGPLAMDAVLLLCCGLAHDMTRATGICARRWPRCFQTARGGRLTFLLYALAYSACITRVTSTTWASSVKYTAVGFVSTMLGFSTSLDYLSLFCQLESGVQERTWRCCRELSSIATGDTYAQFQFCGSVVETCCYNRSATFPLAWDGCMALQHASVSLLIGAEGSTAGRNYCERLQGGVQVLHYIAAYACVLVIVLLLLFIALSSLSSIDHQSSRILRHVNASTAAGASLQEQLTAAPREGELTTSMFLQHLRLAKQIIEVENVELVRTVGRGAFGVVYHVHL